MDAETIVRRMYDAWEREDLDEYYSLIAKDFVYEDVSNPENSHVGRESLRGHNEAFVQRLPDFRLEAADFISSGDSVAVEVHLAGTESVQGGDGKPSTRALRWRGCAIYKADLEHGVITRETYYRAGQLPTMASRGGAD